MCSSKIRWTTSQIEKLRDLTSKNLSILEISKILGKSQHAIASKQNRLNIYKKSRNVLHYSEAEIKELIRLINENKNIEEIVISSKRPRKTIIALVKKLKDNNYIHQAIWTSEQITLLQNLVSNNVGWKEMTIALKKSVGAIIRKRDELGLFVKQKEMKYKKMDMIISQNLVEGKSIEEIAIIINRGSHFVLERCKKLGIIKSFPQLQNIIITPLQRKLEKRFAQTLISTKGQCKKRRLDFQLTIKDLLELWEEQEGRCAYSGSEMTLKYNKNDTYSIDRINSKIGYIRSNVCLCRNDVNWMKMSKTMNEFISLINRISNYRSETVEW